MAEKPRAVVFGAAAEGIRNRFGARMPPALIEQIKALGIDLSKPQVAYTLEAWDQMIRLMLPVLYPGIPEAQAAEAMGFEFIHGFAETLVGKAMLGVARLLGPRRMLGRMNRNFKQIGNHANSRVEVVGPTEVRIETWMSEEFLWEWRGKPSIVEPYRGGVLRGGLDLIGVTAQVEVVKSDPELQQSTYRVRWS